MLLLVHRADTVLPYRYIPLNTIAAVCTAAIAGLTKMLSPVGKVVSEVLKHLPYAEEKEPVLFGYTIVKRQYRRLVPGYP